MLYDVAAVAIFVGLTYGAYIILKSLVMFFLSPLKVFFKDSNEKTKSDKSSAKAKAKAKADKAHKKKSEVSETITDPQKVTSEAAVTKAEKPNVLASFLKSRAAVKSDPTPKNDSSASAEVDPGWIGFSGLDKGDSYWDQSPVTRGFQPRTEVKAAPVFEAPAANATH